jgi:hypothetical protein
VAGYIDKTWTFRGVGQREVNSAYSAPPGARLAEGTARKENSGARCPDPLKDIAAELAQHGELGPGSIHRLVREMQRKYFAPPRFADALSSPRSRRTVR